MMDTGYHIVHHRNAFEVWHGDLRLAALTRYCDAITYIAISRKLDAEASMDMAAHGTIFEYYGAEA